MDYRTIQVSEHDDGRMGILKLNRPEMKNAISVEMRKEIIYCLHKWRRSGAIGAVIITGCGDTFSAGFDLSEFNKPELFEQLYQTSAQYHRLVWTFPKPVIAAVNGPALAGAFDLAKLCDIRVCSPSAIFGHPEIKFGIPPLLTPLRWIVGEGWARYICMTGVRIDAREARQIGLVTEIVDGELLPRAIEIASQLLEAPLPALTYIKQNLLDHAARGFEESFSIEHDKAFQEFLLGRAAQELKKAK